MRGGRLNSHIAAAIVPTFCVAVGLPLFDTTARTLLIAALHFFPVMSAEILSISPRQLHQNRLVPRHSRFPRHRIGHCRTS